MWKLLTILFFLKIVRSELVIESWKQKVTLKGQNPIYHSEIVVVNQGTESILEMEIPLPASHVELLGNIGAEDGYGNLLKLSVLDNVDLIKVNESEDKEFQIVRISFEEPLSAQKTVALQLSYVLYGNYEFLPEKIDLFEDQKVLYYAYIVPTVAFEIRELSVEVKYGDDTSRFTKTFDNVQPYSYKAKRMHFPLNRQFLQMRKSERYIEVSHWGNVKFSEEYDMHNRAAKLTGHFSRVDFDSRNPNVARNAFRASKIELPYEAWGFSFRDELGNISTSVARREDHSRKAVVNLTPRYALQGDWNSTWQIGYNIPAENLLRQNIEGTEFIFEYPVAHTIMEGIADEYVITVALPEGAEIIAVDEGQILAVEKRMTKTYGYLDFFGRPSVVLKFKNHIPRVVTSKVRIRYRFSKQNMMIEPLYLVCGLFTLFLMSITFSRLSLDFKEE